MSLILVLLVFSTSTVGKYVYVAQQTHWPDAQKICRNNYTDLASMSNEYDQGLLYNLYKQKTTQTYMWIGLVRISPNKWMWSGGVEVSKFFWYKEEPDGGIEQYGAIGNYTGTFEWFDMSFYENLAFFCYKVYALWESKTWEEAVRYCKDNHKDLASVASVTEMMLIQKELNIRLNKYVTEHVWIGLRFLAGEWWWVDRQPFEYEAWGPGGRPMCPAVDKGCGALQMMGALQPITVYEPLAKNSGQNVVVGTVDVKVWNAHNCDEKLHFLCY